jgi:hypothetical protein
MSDAELLLTLAGALITVWLSLLVAASIWLGRRTVRRARREISVIVQALRLRTRRAVVNGLGALATLSWLVALALFAAPLLLTVGPLLLAIAGLDLTAHIVKVGP